MISVIYLMFSPELKFYIINSSYVLVITPLLVIFFFAYLAALAYAITVLYLAQIRFGSL